MAIEQQLVIPSDPAARKAINDAVKDACDSKTRIASERDYIKDVVTMIHDKYGLPKKYINKLINTRFKNDKDKVQAETEDFIALYEAVIK